MSAPDPVAMFRQEARDLLESLETVLLDLGETPQDKQLVDAAFRALHTIKGTSAMFGFDAVAAFTHDFETAFDRVRKGEVAAGRDLVSVALAARDHIRALIEAPETADEVIGAAVLANLQALVGARAPAAAVPIPAPSSASSPAAEARAERGVRLSLAFRPDVLRNGTDPLGLLDELRQLGACTVTPRLDAVPLLDDLDPQTLHLGWEVALRGDCSREAIDDVFMFVSDEMTLSVAPLGDEDLAATPPAPDLRPAETLVAADRTPAPLATGVLAAEPPSAEPARPADGESAARGGAERGRRAEDRGAVSVRVPAERLVALMDRVGELVIVQTRLSQLAHGRMDFALTAVAEEIERLASALRDTTMGIRMVPIGSLFARFRRLVHDLSRDLGKPVDFVTSGEDTELDKTMIERLADPIVHLIRNAIDHGIETPERRAKAGKPTVGRIELRAEHVGTQVRVTVHDDGGGLDAARIRAKAEDQGLVPPGAQLSEAEIHQLLFQPGFSTAQTISTLSGRGVGMDVVKRTIEAMRGTIELASAPGRGSSVVLGLPLTLAIIEGLLIRVGEARYVVPLSTIEECLELPAAPGGRARGRDLLDVRGRFVPLLRLRTLFEAEGAPDPHQKVIVVSVGDVRLGLVADGIIASHQTVIKSLSKLHADVTMFSGATILGDGSAALILDVAQLIARGRTRAEAEATDASTAARAA